MTKLTYILAASHSGSTLLTFLLNAHPAVATIGELAPSGIGDPARYRCSCGAFIGECLFWRYIARHAIAERVPFGQGDFGTRFRLSENGAGARFLRPLHRGRLLETLRDAGLNLLTDWRARWPEIVHANETLVRLVMDYYRASVFVDKGNVALRLKYLLKIPTFNTKVIRLVRDGRAVALTYMNPATYADARDPSRRGGGSGGDRRGERLAMTAAAWEWRRSNEEAEHALAGLGRSRWIEVRYEDLCADPKRTLRRIFGFLGLDPSQWAQDFRSAEHHVVGNGMRLDTTSEVQLDERWKSALAPEDLAAFDRIAGRLNNRYGYRP